jgi:hypothetical protein
MPWNIKFHHPVTKEVIDEKKYIKLTDIAEDLGVSRHVLYRYMNDKLTDRYKKSCVLHHTSWEEIYEDDDEDDDNDNDDDVQITVPPPSPDDIIVEQEPQEPEETPEEIIRRYRNEYQTKYRKNNLDKLRKKIECECSGRYTLQTKSSHMKTQKHQRWVMRENKKINSDPNNINRE